MRTPVYALGGYGEYLLSTWFPPTTKGLTVSELSKKAVDWKRLEALSSSQQDEKGTVEFKAWFCKSSSDDDMEYMHEISEFVRVKSRWFYVGGRVNN